MLISEIKGWYYAITWDNPLPADSSGMLKALSKLGKVTTVQTKTTALLYPKAHVDWKRVRRAIRKNLHPKKGNAIYVNLRTGNCFQYGSKTNWAWRSA